jgi:hypothetical protein
MATLIFSEIETIILTNPYAGLIAAGVKKNKELRMHMYGKGLDAHLKIVPGFEKEHLRKLRVEYSRSNRDVFARLGRPVDNVYTAKGGSTYYNLPKEQERRARLLTYEVKDGYSVRDWIENFWTPHYKDDPCGILLLEILPEREGRLAIQQGQSVVYPTYKSIGSIYDYKPKGVGLDYVCFELTAQEKAEYSLKSDVKFYRLIDDAYDYIVRREDNYVIIVQELTLPNLFGYVPGMINSDIVDPEMENSFLSIFTDITELADEFLMKGSIKVTSDLRHGFPKYAEFADDCPKCLGSGVMEAGNCDECKGSGKNPQVFISQTKMLRWPEEGQNVILPKDTGGYVEPSRNYHEIAISDMTMLENYMSLTIWGTVAKIQTAGISMDGTTGKVQQTATGEMLDIKPQANRLYHISKAAEKRDKFIRDGIIRIQVQQNYQGCSSNYGRRYMLEGPDALWLRYSDARAKGVAVSALDDLLMEYYEAKFVSDPMKLAVQVKLIKVEPFVHYKVGEVMMFRLGPEDYKAKLYFGEWLSEQEDGYILVTDATQLRKELYAYVSTKQLQEATPQVA